MDPPAVSSGELAYTIDWRDGRFLQMPLGFQIGKVFRAGSQPLRLFATPAYNAKRLPGANRWSVTLGMMLLAPAR